MYIDQSHDNDPIDVLNEIACNYNRSILFKTSCPFPLAKVLRDGVHTDYEYEGDQLVGSGNESVVYGGNNLPGNPSSYRGRTMEWSNLSDLRRIDDIDLKYNFAGMRISKERDNDRTKYFWSGNRLLAEHRTTTLSDSVWDMLVDETLPIYTDSTLIQYLYGTNGLIGFTIKGDDTAEETYYFQHNLQGDVVRICDEDGTILAQYVYDAWGNHVVLDSKGKENHDDGFIGNINPIRYRSYYFDIETGLYYLKARYYDPSTGRFVNADSMSELDPDKINGLNLYTYCGSNPVMRIDPTGGSSLTKWFKDKVIDPVVNWVDEHSELLITVVVIVAVVALTIATAGLAAPVAGMFGSALLGSIAAGAVVGAIGGAIMGAGISIVSQGLSNGYGNIDWGSVGKEAFIGAVTGAVLGGIGGGIGHGVKAAMAARTAASAERAGVAAKNAVSLRGMTAYEKGLMGEEHVSKVTGLIKTKEGIDFVGREILPDFVGKNALHESKNVARLSMSPQLRIYLAYTEEKGLDMFVWVRQNTIVSKAIKESKIILRYFPW